MTPEESNNAAEAKRLLAKLRSEYSTDDDAYDALSLIVSRLMLRCPGHVREAFAWFNED